MARVTAWEGFPVTLLYMHRRGDTKPVRDAESLAARQYGVVTRSQGRALGMTDDEIDYLLHEGALDAGTARNPARFRSPHDRGGALDGFLPAKSGAHMAGVQICRAVPAPRRLRC